MAMAYVMAAIFGGGISVLLLGFTVGLCLAPLFGTLMALALATLVSLRGM